MHLPNPTWLIDGLVPQGGAAVLAGPANVGKTFVALDMAFCIAAGVPWQGHRNLPGRHHVVYILGEGLGGLRPRVAAWRWVNKVPDGIAIGVTFWDRAVQFASGITREAFRSEVRRLDLPPALIVIDTLARCFVGFDENSVQDMSRFVEAVDIFREDGASVLIVHHAGHDPKPVPGKATPPVRERGSSALRGAVDALHILRRGDADGEVIFVPDKLRDADRGIPFSLLLEPVELPDGSDSLVITRPPWSADQLPASWHAALRKLASAATGMTHADWHSASKLPRATFYRLRRELLSRGLVEQHPDGRFVYVGGTLVPMRTAPVEPAVPPPVDGDGQGETQAPTEGD